MSVLIYWRKTVFRRTHGSVAATVETTLPTQLELADLGLASVSV
jgi:hypothetical protein